MKLTLSKDLRDGLNGRRSNLSSLREKHWRRPIGGSWRGYENMRNIPAGRFVERGEGLPAMAVGTLVFSGPRRVHQRLDETTPEHRQGPERLLALFMSRVSACLLG